MYRMANTNGRQLERRAPNPMITPATPPLKDANSDGERKPRRPVDPAVQAMRDEADALSYCIGRLGALPSDAAKRNAARLNEIFGGK
jgi:hypothetical protein